MPMTFFRCRFVLLLFTGAIIFPLRSVLACDYCSIYAATGLHGFETGSFAFSLSNQYTSYNRTDAGASAANGFLPTREGEILKDFNTTTLTALYDFSESFGLQVLTPLSYRRYERIEQFQSVSGDDFGLGDMAIVGRYAPVVIREPHRILYFALHGGVKLPTGDSDGLKSDSTDAEPLRSIPFLRHHTSAGTGIQGRNFAIGSGSVDYLLGTSLYYQRDRWFAVLGGQYGLRTEGTGDFEFGDDLTWNIGPGYYVVLEEERSVGARLALSGEYKHQDQQRGVDLPGTELLNIYVGPELLLTGMGKWTSEIGIDLPVYSDDNDAFAEPEVRLRLSVGKRF